MEVLSIILMFLFYFGPNNRNLWNISVMRCFQISLFHGACVNKIICGFYFLF